MPVRDIFHNAVRHTLEKYGWRIIHDLLRIDLTDKAFRIFELVSYFCHPALALGQFINYRFVLDEVEPERQQYLAVPFETYQVFFRRELIKKITQEQQLKFIAYKPVSEVVQQ